MVLQENSEIKLLNTMEENPFNGKHGNSKSCHPSFDTVFSQLTAEEFVRTVLVNQFDIHKIIIGHDHRFGRDRTANIDDLISFGKRYGFEVEQISVQEINDLSISSTKIRKAISQGNKSGK
jgi:riboflavin kinase/FMN adenylyltransferase